MKEARLGKETWETVDEDDGPFAGTSLRKRAEKRTVEQIGERTWRVLGEDSLNDAYHEYLVHLPEGDGKRKYDCECYHHGQGDVRRRKMCSHVLATILYRKTAPPWEDPQHKINEGIEEALEFVKATTPAHKPVLKIVDEGVDTPRDDAAGRGEPVGPMREVARFLGVTAGTLNEIALDPRHEALGSPPIPEQFGSFRPHQWQAILEILEHFENGVKAVMLSAPTGSGKTLIGEAVQRLMPGRNVYCCTTKTLQDQVVHDFPYSVVMKGRSNYRTQHRADVTCEECTGTADKSYADCEWCDHRGECPYYVHKETAKMARFPILNMAYFLGETKNTDASAFASRQVVVIDEADTLEDQLMGDIEVTLTASMRKWVGITTLPKKTVPDDWVRWLEEEALPAIQKKRAEVKSTARTLYGTDPKKKRQLVRLERVIDKIRPLLKTTADGVGTLEEGWVMTGYVGKSDGDVTFKPITVAEHGFDSLWSRGRQFLLMTATLISPEQMAIDLGLEDDEWEVVQIGSTFDPERRPVIVDPVASMTAKTKDKSYPKIVTRIDELLDENPGVRILIHTVSYALTEYIFHQSKSGRLLTYRNAGEREATLERFLAIDDAVLLAPSFERGVDLPAEKCEVIIIAKVPFPYLGDKQIAARLHSKGGKTWYAVQTIRAIVQMCGRGMRSKDDWCDTYILDSQFKRLWKNHRRLFPKWFREAVALSMTDPKYKHLIDAAEERRAGRRNTREF